MAEVHDLIEANGKHGAILAGLNRPVVEAAASYMADEDSGLGFAYSGWAQCVKSLPKLTPLSLPIVTPLLCVEVCGGAVGKWPAGATVQSLA